MFSFRASWRVIQTMKSVMHNIYIVSVLWLMALCGLAQAADRALLIGVNTYADQRIRPLHGCESDVSAVRQILVDVGGYTPDQIQVLLSGQATAKAIMQAMKRLEGETQPGDRVVFYYSGHGSQKKNPEKAEGVDEILCPTDYTPQSQDNCVRDVEIGAWLKRMAGRNVVLVVDSCHSGSISKNIDGQIYGVETIETLNASNKFIPPPDETRSKDIHWTAGETKPAEIGVTRQQGTLLRKASATSGGIVSESDADYILLTACASDQTAQEIRVRIGRKTEYRGAFTWFLVQGLSGAADGNQDGMTTYMELFQYVNRVLRRPDVDLPQMASVLTPIDPKKPELRTRDAFMNQPVFGRIFNFAESGKVLSVIGDRITVDRGAQHGIGPGDCFAIVSRPDVAGGSLATFRVEDAEQFTATGTIVTGRANVRVGQSVKKDRPHGDRISLAVYIQCPDSADGQCFRQRLHGELERAGFSVVDTPAAADRVIVLRADSGGFQTIIASRYGEVRSKLLDANVSGAVAGAVRRLRAERLILQFAAVDGIASDIHVELSVEGGRDTFFIRKAPRHCDEISFRVVADHDCYLALIAIDCNGQTTLLFPNKWQTDNRLHANRSVVIPGQDDEAVFVVRAPAGQEAVRAVASLKPLAIKDVNTKSLNEQGYIDLSDDQNLVANIFRSISGKGIGVEKRQPIDSENNQDSELIEIPATGWGVAETRICTHMEQ
jgi:hypothetical protein